MLVKEILSIFEDRMGGYLTDEEKKGYLSEFEAIETERDALVLSENSSLSIEAPFSELYLLYLKLKAEAKANEFSQYQNTQIQFLTLYNDYKRGVMRRSPIGRQTIKYF